MSPEESKGPHRPLQPHSPARQDAAVDSEHRWCQLEALSLQAALPWGEPKRLP